MGALRRPGSRLRATDTRRAPEAHTGLAWTHSRGQMRDFAAPDPREGVHAGKMEFKDLQMILFRFFSAGDRSSIGVLGRRGRKGQESASRLCSRLQSPLLPAALGPCSVCICSGPASLGELLAQRRAEAAALGGFQQRSSPTPDPGSGGAWRGLAGSLVQAGEWGVAGLGPQKTCCIRSDSSGRLGGEQGSDKGQGAAQAP